MFYNIVTICSLVIYVSYSDMSKVLVLLMCIINYSVAVRVTGKILPRSPVDAWKSRVPIDVPLLIGSYFFTVSSLQG